MIDKGTCFQNIKQDIQQSLILHNIYNDPSDRIAIDYIYRLALFACSPILINPRKIPNIPDPLDINLLLKLKFLKQIKGISYTKIQITQLGKEYLTMVCDGKHFDTNMLQKSLHVMQILSGKRIEYQPSTPDTPMFIKFLMNAEYLWDLPQMFVMPFCSEQDLASKTWSPTISGRYYAIGLNRYIQRHKPNRPNHISVIKLIHVKIARQLRPKYKQLKICKLTPNVKNTYADLIQFLVQDNRWNKAMCQR